jgi:hypothetical protein
MTPNKLRIEPRVTRARLLPSGREMSGLTAVPTKNLTSMTMKISYNPKAEARTIQLRSLRDGEHVDRRQPVGDRENVVVEPIPTIRPLVLRC